jgi:hypothetical protein
MRIIILVILNFGLIAAFGQFKIKSKEEVEKVLAVYKEKIDPYIKDMVEKEFAPNDRNGKSDTLQMELKRSRYMLLSSKTILIGNSIKEQFEKNRNLLSDRKTLLKSIEAEYRNTYNSLPPSFFKEAQQSIEKN